MSNNDYINDGGPTTDQESEHDYESRFCFEIDNLTRCYYCQSLTTETELQKLALHLEIWPHERGQKYCADCLVSLTEAREKFYYPKK